MRRSIYIYVKTAPFIEFRRKWPQLRPFFHSVAANGRKWPQSRRPAKKLYLRVFFFKAQWPHSGRTVAAQWPHSGRTIYLASPLPVKPTAPQRMQRGQLAPEFSKNSSYRLKKV
jgi:hypothetical protein